MTIEGHATETETTVSEPPAIDAGKLIEELDTATRSGDAVTVKRINDQLNGTTPEVTPAAKPAEPVAQTPEQVAAAAKEKKKFRIKWDGEDVERDDEDTYLGFGSHGALKRNTIITEQRHKKLKADFDKAMEKLNATNSEIAATRADRDRLVQDYEAKLKTNFQAPVVAASSEAAPVVEDDELVAPVYPEDLPDEPLEYTDEQRRSVSKYHKDLSKFNAKLVAMRKKPVSTVSAPAQDAETPREKELRLKLDKIEQENAQKAKDDATKEETEKVRKQHDAVWEAASKFQEMHKDFGTPRSLRDIHSDVVNWMDQLAEANGVSAPSRLSATPDELRNYTARRGQVVKQFLAGDKSVLENSEGVKAPEGYQQYFEIADLVNYKNQLVAENIFAPGIDLHAVWAYKQDREGGFDQATTQIAADATRQGANSVLSAMSGRQQEFARNIPAGSAALAPESTGDPTAQANLLQKASTAQGLREIYGDPELKKQYDAFMAMYAN